MAQYANALRSVPASALDPDGLEQVIAGQLSRPDGGLLVPFLFNAQAQRMARGNAMMEQQDRVNVLANALAQREQAMQDMNSRRTFSASLAQHAGVSPFTDAAIRASFGSDPETVGLMQEGQTNFQQGQEMQRLRTAGQASNDLMQGGINANQAIMGSFGNRGMREVQPTSVQAAGARAAGSNRDTYRQTTRPDGTTETSFQTNDPSRLPAGNAAIRGLTPGQIAQMDRIRASGGTIINDQQLSNGMRTMQVQIPGQPLPVPIIMDQSGNYQPAPTGRPPSAPR